MPKMRQLYADYNALQKAIALLNWDQQVLMPPGGAEARSAHVTTLTKLAHRILTSDEMRRELESAKQQADPDSLDAKLVATLERDVFIQSKLPGELVERKSKVGSAAYEVWKSAKRENDFPCLEPFLTELFSIAAETAEHLGYTNHIYDPLIDLFERGSSYADAQAMFASIKQPIIDMVRQIGPADDSFLRGNWDQAKLRSFAQSTAEAIGYRFDRGRLDVCTNAFCTTIGTADVRMTTRPSDHLKGIVSSSLHEMGHGLYEQNSPPEWDRTPLQGGISLAVHESQSRMWENIVGRSLPFWSRFLPDLQSAFPQLNSVDLQDFYRAINRVEPEFVRVGADELSYNLHILIRFELEIEILTKQLEVKHLPEAWNSKYTEYLGITPPTDTAGCLQDVHWSRGMVGYFPTYSMGNLIGAQIWETLSGDIPNTDDLMQRGDFQPILGWLTEQIYSKGKSIPPRDLVTQVTGRPMEAGPWLKYARIKYGQISGVE